MKITIDTEVLRENNLTLEEFVILLYYVQGMTAPIEEVCESLWRKNLLIKEIEGYSVNTPRIPEIQGMLAMSGLKEKKTTPKELIALAEKILEVYPAGKMPGTSYYYRCSPDVLAKRLAVFFSKFPRKLSWTDEAIVESVKDYVASFNGNYRYLQLLKYFVYRTADDKSVDSQLLNYLSARTDAKERAADVSSADNWLNDVR